MVPAGAQGFLLFISIRTQNPMERCHQDLGLAYWPQSTHRHAQRFASLVIVDSVILAINVNDHSDLDWGQTAPISAACSRSRCYHASPAAHPLGEVCIGVH